MIGSVFSIPSLLDSVGEESVNEMLSGYSESAVMPDAHKTGFKRTGKSDFVLPADFDEHFDDLNDEIATMFMGESL